MTKTPKADALRALRERQADRATIRWADDKRAIAKRALVSAEVKQSKRRKKPVKKRKTKMRTAAVVSSVKHAHLISAIARAVAMAVDVPKPRGVAVEVLMQLFTLPREQRAALAAELIKPDPVPMMEEEDHGEE